MNTATPTLQRKITRVLRRQGYSVKASGVFSLRVNERDNRREAHKAAKNERMSQKEDFILDNMDWIKERMVDGRDLTISRIDPELVEVRTGTPEDRMFKWWNLVWWSLPYERAYGRQMRFVIWDRYHQAPIGLIGLQSPILSWAPRDTYLGIDSEGRDYWVNQSLSAQRIGALPPYSYILGGKLVTLLMTSDVVRNRFGEKYSGLKTVMKKRVLPAQLLFITTTGAYGKSVVYDRIKFNGMTLSKFVGYTKGCGTFHIPNALYENLLDYLEERKIDVMRGYGNGPSRKLRLIDKALHLLDFTKGVTHGIKRAVYLFPFATNVTDVIQQGAEPEWQERPVDELTNLWKQKWAYKRARKGRCEYRKFFVEHFVRETKQEMEKDHGHF